MRVDDLKPTPGSGRAKRRVGRGIGGHGGKTAGRGTKGQRARNTVARGFEGGQMPLKQRVPKLKGFNNPNRVEYAVINLDRLAEAFAGGEADPSAMLAAGLVRKGRPVKVLAGGELSGKLVVRAQAFSEAARRKIEAAGGTAEIIPYR